MKKKGFTLIELLAVIVILAIIALIAVPIVLNIINNSKESAKLRSAELYLDAVNNSIAQYQLDNNEIADGTYEIMSDGNICLGTITDGVCDNTLNVSVDGEKPVGDSITIENSKIKDVTLNYGTDKILMDANGNLAYEVILAPGLYNEEGELLASWDELVNDYGLDVESDHAYNSTTRPAAIIDDNFEDADKLIIGGTPSVIGKFAFYECAGLSNIELPNSVTTIRELAFEDCIGLKSIKIPDSVTSIGSSAFQDCTNLETVILGIGITSIESSTFSECWSLQNIQIPQGVTSIGNYAFYATNLVTINIPDSVVSIGNEAFMYNTKLKDIEIPSSVTSIGASAFEECDNLTAVYFNQTTAPILGSYCFSKYTGVKTTFYFKNSTVADAFTTDYYDATYGIKSTDYNW